MLRITRRILSVLLTAGLFFTAGGCRREPAVTVLAEPGRPAVPSGEEASADPLLFFAADLLRESLREAPGENVLVSPLCVMTALAMTAGGARGETRSQMEAALGAEVPELNALLASVLSGLPRDGALRFRLADSVWFTDDPDFSVNPDFLETNRTFYGAGIYRAPFVPETREVMNRWVRDRTDGMIPEILDRIPEDAVMCLISALAFDAEWAEPYREDQTDREAEFHLENGETRSCTLLRSTERVFLESEHAYGVIRPYRGGRYVFAGLLPKEGTVGELAEKLTGAELAEMLDGPETGEVTAAVPKFDAGSSVELSGILRALGMTDALDAERADFGDLGGRTAPGTGPFIGRILHRTALSLGEKGTRAGAAAAVEVNVTCCRPAGPRVVTLDRPFLYLILDTERRIPLFFGVEQDPQ